MRRKGIASLAGAAGVSLGAAVSRRSGQRGYSFHRRGHVQGRPTPEIPVGFGGGVAGDLTIGTSATTFQAGDTITISLDDSDSVQLLRGVGFRDSSRSPAPRSRTSPAPPRRCR